MYTHPTPASSVAQPTVVSTPVRSHSDTSNYDVALDLSTGLAVACSCPHHQRRGAHCKHMREAEQRHARAASVFGAASYVSPSVRPVMDDAAEPPTTPSSAHSPSRMRQLAAWREWERRGEEHTTFIAYWERLVEEACGDRVAASWDALREAYPGLSWRTVRALEFGT